ncbi:hypothetical protein QJS10_CPA06g02024 [Acorus calamus]|uniref:RNA helicase n=1 Tax=Acorus calamus TaxID=4465 RepID=A0AAV9ERB9_ACOCL|nr:hypothetical protein QJS10_CPA06g02024 [Acorus calamus]
MKRYYLRQPPPQRRQPVYRANFEVLLELSAPSAKHRRESASSAAATLISSCPVKPSSRSFLSSGTTVAKFSFPTRTDAVEAVVYVWRRRLEKDHRLNPRIVSTVPFDESELTFRLKALFAGHAVDLMEGEVASLLEARIEEVSEEIRGLSGSLSRRPNQLRMVAERIEKKRRLFEEKAIMEGRLGEFRAAMRCMMEKLGESVEGFAPCYGDIEDEKFGPVEVIGFGGNRGFDWGSIYCTMIRECKRLETGLPIYACRRKILRTVEANQVVVLIGETGSGKSTQLVQYLADSGIAGNGAIVCTQPRKIAAMSVAQRVGEECNGCYGNDSDVTYTTYLSAQKFNSKVIFTTDHCLLQHCMYNKKLEGVSCVIVDEAHERSLNTDLLLALVKQRLSETYDLKLIVMSATADANKLAEYFHGCPSFHVKGRNFPVKIKYVPDASAEACWASVPKINSNIATSYVLDVVQMAQVIHKNEVDGTILAFLTSQMEVEWACENFHSDSAVALPLHGKLSCEDQNHVFQKYEGKRKVIFTTNLAETSLTIPGVKYVIDSGMAKESRFEPGTAMNVLRVCRISQSSANQRAGRAGRTEPGQCYRLYTENEFQLMPIHQEPEIRKVHLGIAVLRILALGVKNVREFDFVDAPGSEAIEMAIRNLIQLGAIVNKNGTFELTGSGRSLVKLGIEPRLGKLMLDSVDGSLGKEGVILAAVMANANNIFCRVGSDEDKLKSDCLKIPFCHRDGDLFTLLSVYKEWESLHPEDRNKWCWDNSINAKSMRRCKDTIHELEYCMRHELNIIIPSFWTWDPQKPTVWDKLLKKIILSCLAENVAMYTGRDRLGYEVALTGHCVQLHPSCSLLMYGQKPNWVVFGELLSISNQYMVCVTAIDFEFLPLLQPPPLFDVLQLENRKLHRNVNSGLSSNVLRRLCGKLNSNLLSLIVRAQAVCMDDRISIDVDFEKGEVQIFASPKDMDKVTVLVNEALDYETKLLQDECIEKCLFRGCSGATPSIALLGAGGEIRHLELEKRYLTVEVSHPSARTLEDKELLMKIANHVSGIANPIKYVGLRGLEGQDAEKWGKITFLSPEAAENAVANLNDVEFHGSPLRVCPLKTAFTGSHKLFPFPAVRARVSWPRRPSKGVAFVTCAAEDTDFILRDCTSLAIAERYVYLKWSTSYPGRIKLGGIGQDVTEAELYDSLRSVTNRRIQEVYLVRGEAVDHLSGPACAEALKREIFPFMPINSGGSHFHVEVFNPEPKDYMMKAVITFDGSLHLEAAKALEHLEGRVLVGCLPWQKISCQRMFHSSVPIPSPVYRVIRTELDTILGTFKNQKDRKASRMVPSFAGVNYKLERNENGSHCVRISAVATKIMADFRSPLEQLIKGRTVTDPRLTTAVLHLLFCREGMGLMKSVEHETGTYILYDKQNLNVRVFGPPNNVTMAEQKLVECLLSMYENKQLQIRLRERDLPPDLMKEVVKKFGQTSMGSRRSCQGPILPVETTRDGAESSCPICLCEVEDGYRLEACGHEFCRSCLVEQCESAIKSREGFPMCCSQEGCKQKILLVDLRSLLNAEKVEELFRASLGAFVASSGGTYRFCPSPDCPSVYRVADHGSSVGLFSCGACGADTCTRCHLEHHPFLSCERYKEFKEDPDVSLGEWCMGKENVKKCPACGFTIEKIDGCNHIECKCGNHVCWVCLKSFTSSNDCYSHLRAVHQTIS